MSVLFVCTGNICRSPSAEGVLRHLVAQRGWAEWVHVDSAGTTDWHVGEPPDRRSQAHAIRRGYDLSALRARAVEVADFERFDWVLAMDDGHMAELLSRCPAHLRHRVRRLMDFAPAAPRSEVADPYYGGPEGFEQVLDDVEAGCEGLLAFWQAAQHVDLGSARA